MLFCLPQPALQVCQVSFEKEGGEKGGEVTKRKRENKGGKMENDGSWNFNIKMVYNFNNRIRPQISSSLPLSQGALLSVRVFTRMG